MFEQTEKKSLFIVFDNDTEEIANYIFQLISLKDDKEDGTLVGPKDGSIKASLWDEKKYLDSRTEISSDNHILLLGSKVVDKNRSHMPSFFSEYGMNYGWLGKTAFIYVESEAYKKEKYDAFVAWAKKDREDFQASITEDNKVAVGAALAVAAIVGGLALPGGLILTRYFKNKGKYLRERRIAIALHFYLYGLAKFMEM